MFKTDSFLRSQTLDPTLYHVITAPQRRKKRNKIGLLTVVLTILADGESGLQCQVTGGSRGICLEDVEALGFLQEKYKNAKKRMKRERDVCVNGVQMFLLLS